LPPLAIGFLERIAFNTTYFSDWIAQRFAAGPRGMGSGKAQTIAAMTAPLSELLLSPGFWLGLLVTAAFLAGAVHLRRSRGPS
jgi:hypothetical protein